MFQLYISSMVVTFVRAIQWSSYLQFSRYFMQYKMMSLSPEINQQEPECYSPRFTAMLRELGGECPPSYTCLSLRPPGSKLPVLFVSCHKFITKIDYFLLLSFYSLLV